MIKYKAKGDISKLKNKIKLLREQIIVLIDSSQAQMYLGISRQMKVVISRNIFQM